MGLFDKIRDNARDLSIKALDATREYDEDYLAQQQKKNTPAQPASDDAPVDQPAQTIIEPAEPEMSFEEPVVETTPEEPTEEQAKQEEKPAEEPEKPARKSKVTEISKAEYEQTQKEKQRQEEQEKTKQAAKERLAKSYTPSYKSSSKKEGEQEAETEEKPATANKPAAVKPRSIPVGIVDVTPGKFTDPTKQAIYARERAALTALASQRKLNGTVPLYVATHMNFKTRVFVDRIEYSGSFGKNTLPISQVSWVKLRAGGTGVILETTEGKRVVMVVKPADRLAFAEAVLRVQSMQPKRGKFKDTKTVRIDQLEEFSNGVDEIEKLAKLFDKGILSQEEFDAKKKQILGL